MNDQNKITATKSERKGSGGLFRLFLIIPYASISISLLLFIIAILDLVDITKFDMSGVTAIDYGLSFAILAIVSRIYYKMFKRD